MLKIFETKQKNVVKATIILLAVLLFTGIIVYTRYIQVSPRNLLRDMAQQTKDLTSTKMAMNIVLDVNGKEGKSNFNMSSRMSMDMSVTLKPVATKGIGTMSMTTSGKTQKADMEMYMVEDGDQYVTYANTNGTWVKSKNKMPKATEYYLVGLEKYHKNFKLEKELKNVDGRTCYVLKGKIRAKALGALMSTAIDRMEKVVSAIGQDGWADREVPVALYISQKDQNPVKLTADVEEIVKKALNKEGGNINIETCLLEIQYKSFDSVSLIQVPDDIKAKAVESISDTKEADQKKEVTELKPKGAEQSRELGNVWKDMTISINDQLVTLPCTYEEFANTGLELDTEFGEIAVDTVLEPKMSKYVYYKPSDSANDYLEASILNSSDLPTAARDSLVTSVSYRDAQTAAEINIVLPGGIKMGSSKEEVIALYGEPAETKEDYYTWQADQGDGTDSLTLRIEEEKGVTYLSVKHSLK